MKQLVILISPTGKGTNLKALLIALQEKKISATLAAVISDTPDAPGLKYAKRNKIPIAFSSKKSELLPQLQHYLPDYIVLAGWKQFIPQEVLDAYKNKILNLHPGIIPDEKDGIFMNPDGTEGLWNKGLYGNLAIQNFLQKKATYAGSSVHFLTDEFDFGPVVGRTFEKIQPTDTVQSIYSRLKKKEHALYIKVLAKLCNEH